MVFAEEAVLGFEVKLHSHESDLLEAAEVEVHVALWSVALERCSHATAVSAELGACILYGHDDSVEVSLEGLEVDADSIGPEHAHLVHRDLSALYGLMMIAYIHL
jgi:hypothetical protein